MLIVEIETKNLASLRYSPMTVYRAQIRLAMNSTRSTIWIEFPAINANIAKAQLQTLYGKNNVLAVNKKLSR